MKNDFLKEIKVYIDYKKLINWIKKNITPSALEYILKSKENFIKAIETYSFYKGIDFLKVDFEYYVDNEELSIFINKNFESIKKELI